MKTRLIALAVTLLSLPGGAARGASTAKPLFDFGPQFNTNVIRAENAGYGLDGGGLRVSTGHAKQWPGVTLNAPGKWDLTAFGQVEAEIKNMGGTAVSVSCRVDDPTANGTDGCVTGSVKLAPGETGTVRVLLKRAADSQLGGRLFGMRGYPAAPGGRGTINPTNITRILFFVATPTIDHEFRISNLRAAGRFTPPTAWVTDADPFFPFIDEFGQYRHKDWPGKVKSVSDLKERRESEAAELDKHPGPEGWDEFGGWMAGPQLKATGFFRTEKFNGKWWFVDPKGRLFFSSGVDCVLARHYTPIDDRAEWFAEFPGDKSEFAPFLGKSYALKGHYAGRSPRAFSFNSANLYRKYGPEWRDVYAEVIHKRLRSWGLNTIANWSDDAVRMKRRTPYTDTIGSHGSRMIAGTDGYWSKFPDPFDPAFKQSLKKQMEMKRGKTAGDPWCLGYFSDNEMSWGDDLSLAIGALKSPADQPAKAVFVQQLRLEYDSIEKLNEAWNTKHASWETLLSSTNAPDKGRAKKDLGAFYTRIAEEYFRTVNEAIKEVAPHQLYLGCRFAWVNDRAAAAAAKRCDVVSYNLYQRTVANFKFNGGADVPLIIGEFHFGALDRGMLHTGLVPVATQQERAQAWREYVTGALRHPQFVGCHWFEYQDEPITGRVYDEENYQIGFVDVADTPYDETIQALREVGSGMYALRAGN